MPTRHDVTDPSDDRLDDYRLLRDADLRKRYENQVGVFIAESPNVVRELATSPYPVRSLLLTPQRWDDLGRELDVDAPAYVAEREVIDEVVRFPLHQGAIAVGGRLPARSLADVIAGARTVAVLEENNDPENLGVIFRSARALGIGGVVLGPRSSDPLYRRAVRVSMGHVLHTPYTRTTDLLPALDELRAAGFRLVALTPADDAVDLAEVPRDDRVAILLGAEGPGLTDEAMAASDLRVRIPISTQVDSLNVGTAAAIAFHALGRP